jgi:translation initiation factor 2 beta subunit (eIF-2beta)/eIF-5
LLRGIFQENRAGKEFVILKRASIINSKVLMEEMKMEKKIYQTLDKVPETGVYICDVCDESLGKNVEVSLKKGDYFPKCSACGDTDIWRKK